MLERMTTHFQDVADELDRFIIFTTDQLPGHTVVYDRKNHSINHVILGNFPDYTEHTPAFSYGGARTQARRIFEEALKVSEK